MTTPDELDPATRVRKRLILERTRRKWNQKALAEAAGVVKTTIVELEKGRRLSENTEVAVEDALGWQPGALDRIRAGLEPIPVQRYPEWVDTERRTKGREEQAMFDMGKKAGLPEDETWSYIFDRRQALGSQSVTARSSQLRRTAE